MSVITRDIGGRDLVQFYAPMHHHVVVNSPIAGRNLLLKNAYGKPLRPPHEIEPITPTLVLENFAGRETRRLSCAMRDIARTHVCKYTCIIDGNNARRRHPALNTRIEIPRGAKLLSVDSRARHFYSTLISLRVVSYR